MGLNFLMKILHICNLAYKKSAEQFYNTDRKISFGLQQNGHFVYDFSFKDMAYFGTIWRTKKIGAKWANAEVLRLTDNLQPDLVLIGHCPQIDPETLKQIRQKYPNIKIAFWYVDPIYESEKIKFIHKFQPYLDTIFTTTGGELLQQFAKDHTTAAYMPNMVNPAVEIGQSFKAEQLDFDFVFCGSAGDQERVKFVEQLKQKIAFAKLYLPGFVAPKVYGAKYIRTLMCSRMGLSYSRNNQISLYVSDRIAQLTGHGLLTFTPVVPDLKLLFSEQEVVYFNDLDDLADKVEYFKQHPEQAQQIAEAGWKRAHSSYHCQRVTKFMLETIFDKPYSENYEWLEHVFKK